MTSTLSLVPSSPTPPALETIGRRVYLRGTPYAFRDLIKEAGAHWDAVQRAWWMSSAKRGVAERLIAEIATQAARAQQVETEREAALPPATGAMVAVEGNTYPVRDQLRELGGRWDADAKVWRVPESRAEMARAIVAAAPKSERSSFRSSFRRFGGNCRGCRGPIVHAKHHRAMGGLCGNCAFDEYDC